MKRDLVTLRDVSRQEIKNLIALARRLKADVRARRPHPWLSGRTLAMIFEKPSLRTRVSFAVAMTQLGGNGLVLRQEEVGLATREPVEDVARVVSSMCDGIMARTFEHAKVTGLAKYSTVPVINALTDYNHPCQAMADLMTLEEHFGNLAGRTIAFIGDGNNVARSLAIACGKFGMRFVLSAPVNYELPQDEVDAIRKMVPDLDFELVRDAQWAVKSADCIYTDTWISMGQEEQKAQRVKDFNGYQVNEALLAAAPRHAVVLHCLPAYRGLEITEEVMNSPKSLVFPEAENRLHFQKGLLAVLMGGK